MQYVDELSWVSVFGPRADIARSDDGYAQVAIGADIHVRGWALCDDDSVAAGGVVQIGDGDPQSIWYGAPRPDIATRFARPEIVACGFDGIVRAPDRCGSFDVRLRLLHHDGSSHDASLCTLEVVAGTPQFPERLGDGELMFAIDEIRAVPGDGLRGPRLPMGCVAIVTGSVRARNRRNVPAMVYGTLIDAVPRCAVGGKDDVDGTYRFVWRFQTAERAYGRHTFTFSALTPDRVSYGSSEAYAFESFEPEEPALVKASRRMPGEIVRVGDGERLRVGDTVYVRGWAIDLDFPSGVHDAVVRIDGDAPLPLESRQYRSDIAHRLKIPEALYCGFVGTLPTTGLAPGRHRVEVFLMKQFGGRYCETEAELSFELRP